MKNEAQKEYNHLEIEKKWQKEWDSKKLYEVKNTAKGKKFYGLIEFPYPSGAGLHVGHIRSNTAMDIISRKRRMEGYNVLYPIGWDAFGLPTENFAIKTGIQPAKVTRQNTDTFRRQLKSLGFSFDWSREVNTTDPAYYKWTQWIFLQMFKKGLAYKAKTEINWCPKDKIGLANEEAEGGICDRCGGPTEKRVKEQWMLAITKYADRLDKDLDDVNYLEKIKIQQRNWIGKSEGSEIEFKIKNIESKDKIVILHGRNGTSKNYFYPWLKQELEKTGAEVFLPDLPNTQEPNDEEQADYVINNIPLDRNTTIITHSFGGIVAMRILERGIKIKGLIQFSTPFSGKFLDGKIRQSVTNAIKKGFDLEKIKKQADYFKVVFDTSDNIVPKKDAEILAKELGVIPEPITATETHFCALKEPEMLDVIFTKIKVFTTRADTLFGVTYVVLAPEHELVNNLKSQIANWSEVEKYVKDVKKKTDIERTDEGKEKTGVELKGIVAINPSNNEEVPVYVADYVLPHYGTGAVMAVPAHDERDFAFAKKYNLPIKRVVQPNVLRSDVFINQKINLTENLTNKQIKLEKLEEIYTGTDGKLINSGEFTDMYSETARDKFTEKVGGKIVTKFKLRDWVFSRQRYWGEPIPIVNCEKCGYVPLNEKDLPLELPKVKSYAPTDNGESPLANITAWVNTKCPKCKGKAKRETDTMPNWAGSSWYFLRYTDPKNKKEFANKNVLKYWMKNGIDWYNGGMEHTTLHLLYSRFWHKFLYDLKVVPTSEPYMKRTSHGMILAEGGEKMSKSVGNTVNPDEIVKLYGADTLRMYEMFMGPFDQAVSWSTESMIGPRRFLERVWRLGQKVESSKQKVVSSETIQNTLHKTIKKVTEDIESMNFNTAVSSMMVLLNEMEKCESVSVKDYKIFLQILAPFAPHIAEELWIIMGESKSIHLSKWPKFDPKKLESETIKIGVQVNGKVRAELIVGKDDSEEDVTAKALADENVIKWIDGKSTKKIIYVKGRLVNIVI